MPILVLFALLGGIVTILSPCILPILPIVLTGSVTGGKKRPFGVVVGFIASFTFFTLFLTAIVKATGLDANILRVVAVAIVAFFGLSLIITPLQVFVEKLFSPLANLASKKQGAENQEGFWPGVILGISLGLVWTPCVGPILAAIIALAATSAVGATAVAIMLAYAIGTSIPLFAITVGGRRLLETHPWLLKNSQSIQKAFGVLMLVTALAIYLGWDRQFQAYILTKFPSYGTGLTQIENNSSVQNELDTLKKAQGSIMNIFGTTRAPEFIAGGQWFNSKPLTMEGLRGKVVLVDFWTYTCINCIRTLPYVKSWWQKYKDKGLVIVGVHTPEFEFEKDPNNVAKAIKDFGLTYPIMQDNDYATWNAYANHYWPADYLVDTNGKIIDTHFGEGDYDATEKKIQEALNVSMPINNPTYQVQAQTPETYLGNWRIDNFASPERIIQDKLQTFSLPKTLESNTFAFGGPWTIGYQRAAPGPNAELDFNFTAKNVFLVMRPAKDGVSGKVKVSLDGKDVKTITIDTDKLYTLIELDMPGAHLLKLNFLDGNVELYAFTFG